ncbi:lipase B precursor [Decorospora gaudefroyi]|uniref:Lipase B n=1 Tax=Decorospora gaudefroyi TaxID=184978 RepID=A0A6A5K2M1_9PLEO|nr:lipase B precursor [Decorospora gaudefroyi]
MLPLSLAAPAPVPVSGPVSAPAPVVTPAPSLEDERSLEERQLLKGLLPELLPSLTNLLADLGTVAVEDVGDVLSVLKNIKPTARPTNIEDALSKQSSIWAAPTSRTDFFAAVATQVANGLVLDDTLKTAISGGLAVGENSINNNNPAPPSSIYPKKNASDAPYSLSESALRRAIYIPSSFTYGAKPPVIFVPGTGAYGGSNYANNLRKLLTGTSYADPIWLNIPGAMLADTQKNAEYIAYAINYISAISSNSTNMAVISWSQGGLDTQWVFTFWPSTQHVVRDHLSIAPDFKGTVLANILCLSANSDQALNLCDPAVIQQEATSDFVRTLRAHGGDAAYVPTTTFYSAFFDEIVQPQYGTVASSLIRDARNVGVSNNEVQSVCAGRLGGTFYGHAGVLFHPLTYALVVDALQHEGPGRLERIDVPSVCSEYVAPGLDLDDVVATTGLIPVAGALLLSYPVKMFDEPALMSYAV